MQKLERHRATRPSNPISGRRAALHVVVDKRLADVLARGPQTAEALAHAELNRGDLAPPATSHWLNAGQSMPRMSAFILSPSQHHYAKRVPRRAWIE